MRVDVQWATNPTAGYVSYGHTEWNSTPNRGDPTKGQPPTIDATQGLIAHVAAMGVRMPQADFYAVESHPNDIAGENWALGMRIKCWTEAGHGDTTVNRAWVWEFSPPARHPNSGTWVWGQRVTVYAEPTDTALWIEGRRYTTPWRHVVGERAYTTIQPYANFTTPPNPAKRYGVTLEQSAYDALNAYRPKSWTDYLVTPG